MQIQTVVPHCLSHESCSLCLRGLAYTNAVSRFIPITERILMEYKHPNIFNEVKPSSLILLQIYYIIFNKQVFFVIILKKYYYLFETGLKSFLKR